MSIKLLEGSLTNCNIVYKYGRTAVHGVVRAWATELSWTELKNINIEVWPTTLQKVLLPFPHWWTLAGSQIENVKHDGDHLL